MEYELNVGSVNINGIIIEDVSIKVKMQPEVVGKMMDKMAEIYTKIIPEIIEKLS